MLTSTGLITVVALLAILSGCATPGSEAEPGPSRRSEHTPSGLATNDAPDGSAANQTDNQGGATRNATGLPPGGWRPPETWNGELVCVWIDFSEDHCLSSNTFPFHVASRYERIVASVKISEPAVVCCNSMNLMVTSPDGSTADAYLEFGFGVHATSQFLKVTVDDPDWLEQAGRWTLALGGTINGAQAFTFEARVQFDPHSAASEGLPPGTSRSESWSGVYDCHVPIGGYPNVCDSAFEYVDVYNRYDRIALTVTATGLACCNSLRVNLTSPNGDSMDESVASYGAHQDARAHLVLDEREWLEQGGAWVIALRMNEIATTSVRYSIDAAFTAGNLADDPQPDAAEAPGPPNEPLTPRPADQAVAPDMPATLSGSANNAAWIVWSSAGASAAIFLVWKWGAAGGLRNLGQAIPLFSRLDQHKLEAHPKRAALLAFVEANPGASVSDARRTLGAVGGNVGYHVRRLREGGLLRTVREGSRLRLFTVPSKREPEPYLTAVQREILAHAAERPGITQAQLAMDVGMSRENLHYHAKKLKRMGRLRRIRDGPVVRHYASD